MSFDRAQHGRRVQRATVELRVASPLATFFQSAQSSLQSSEPRRKSRRPITPTPIPAHGVPAEGVCRDREAPPFLRQGGRLITSLSEVKR